MARGMPCRTVRSLLPRDLAGTLSSRDACQVAEHIQSCRSCSIAYESAREAAECMSGKRFDGEQGVTSQTAVLCGALTDCELGGGGGK